MRGNLPVSWIELCTLIPWRRQWHPTPGLLPGKSHGQRSLGGCSPWGRKESDTTEQLHSLTHSLTPPKEISTSDCDLIWKWGLYRFNNLRSDHEVGPTPIWLISLQKGEIGAQTCTERKCEDTGSVPREGRRRDWSSAAGSHGTPRVGGHHHKLGLQSLPQTWGEHDPQSSLLWGIWLLELWNNRFLMS